MLRYPTHIVGHDPTSSATATTTASSSTSLNHQHQQQYQNHYQNNNECANINGAVASGNTIRPCLQHSNSPTTTAATRTSLFDSCHRKIRLIGGGPVAFLGGLVAKARRKERDGDQSSTDTKLYLEESVLERKLPDADLKALVDLPAGLDYNEWLASHTLALFEHVNLVYGTISEFCTTTGCPDMTGPSNRTYLWFDEKGKKSRVAAPQYIDYVMTFTQKTVNDESIFPTKYANEFPSLFESIARKILRLQFHVIAHLYAAHFREITLLGLHTHLNLTFAHLTALHRRFNLIDEKETDVLRDLEIALRLSDNACTINVATETAKVIADESSGSGNLSYNGINGSTSMTTFVRVTIDGDASVQPICTQPEAMKSLSSDQSDIRSGAGGGGLFTGSNNSETSAARGFCSSGSNISHIDGILNFIKSHNTDIHPSTFNSGSPFECNINTTRNKNSHTTTTV